MSFWNLSDGTNVEEFEEFEIGGSLEPIPDGTECLAAIEEVSWEEWEGDRFINIKWRIAQPEEYNNRVIFQKVKVYGTSKDRDPQKTADNAKRMLAAINNVAKGDLHKTAGEPTNAELMTALTGKLVIIRLAVWKFNEKSGNWVSAVSAPKNSKKKKEPSKGFFLDDDDIPF